MFIVHVTPIVKSRMSHLSYFSADEIPVGSVIQVPLRSKEVPALVLEVEDAKAIKSLLRTNTYETKKIRKQKPSIVFTSGFVRAINETAKYFATSEGSLIQSYTPTAILDTLSEGKMKNPIVTERDPSTFEKLALQLPKKERFEKYKTLIRGNFAKGESVFLCVPTINEATAFLEEYSKGIEQYSFLLESSSSKKKQLETWNLILKEEHPVLIIGTPVFLSIPRWDLSMYIIENEVSSSFKQQVRPKVDARVLIENIARETKSSLIYAGTTLSLKVQKEILSGFITRMEEHSRRMKAETKVVVVDAKEDRVLAKEKKREFPSLSSKTVEKLKESVSLGKRAFVFAGRRGLASQTVCNDCDQVVTCNSCNSPMVLHEGKNSRNLLCHRCGSGRDANESCVSCNSWDLVPLGIGIERIQQYIEKNIREAAVYVLSSDTAKTPKQAKKIVEEFYATEGAVLVGTEMALPYIKEEVFCSVMSSLDSLLSIADFHIEEKIFGIIARLCEMTSSSLLIESTSVENPMLGYAKSGSISEYVKYELDLREKLLYPPFSTLVKVTCSGTRIGVISNMQKFVELTKEYNPRVFAGFIKKGQNLELNVLIKIRKWPEERLVEILKALPMQFSVDVDPTKTL